MKKVLSTQNDTAALIIRLGLGIMIWPHGAQKLLGWFDGRGYFATIASMGESGIPAPLAFLAIVAEFFGGLGLIFGCLTRIAALGVLVVMLVAVFKVHLKNGFFLPGGFEFHLLAIAMALAIILRGGGALSLDRLISSRRS